MPGDCRRGRARLMLMRALAALVVFIASAQAHASWEVVEHNLYDMLTPVHFYDAVHDGGKLVAVGAYGLIATSDDARTWNVEESGTQTALFSIARSPTAFVAVGAYGAIYRSADGHDWTRADFFGPTLLSVSYCDGRFVAVGHDAGITDWQTPSDPAVVYSDDDGLTWRAAIITSKVDRSEVPLVVSYVPPRARYDLISRALVGVAWNGSEWLAVERETYAIPPLYPIETRKYANYVLKSPDGVNWTESVVTDLYDGFQSLASGQGLYVATDSQRVYYSYNGSDWFDRVAYALPFSHISYDYTYFRAVRYVDGQFYAVGDGGVVTRSPNGVSWYDESRSGPHVPRTVVTGWGRNYILGDGGLVLGSLLPGETAQERVPGAYRFELKKVGLPTYYSTEQNVAAPVTVADMAYNTSAGEGVGQKELFLAVGERGLVASSEDGEFWDYQQMEMHNISGITVGMRYQSFSGGLEEWGTSYVAVGQKNADNVHSFVAVSDDGLGWSYPDNTGVTCQNGYDYDFLSGKCKKEGADDLPAFVMPAVNLNSVAYGNGVFLSVGDAGTVLWSTAADDWWPIKDAEGQNPSRTTLRDVIFDGGEFVAVGDGEWIITGDGSSFIIGKGLTLKALTYGDNRYVGVDAYGKVWSSPNARTWFEGPLLFGVQTNGAAVSYQRRTETDPGRRWLAARYIAPSTPWTPALGCVLAVSADAGTWYDVTQTDAPALGMHHAVSGKSKFNAFGVRKSGPATEDLEAYLLRETTVAAQLRKVGSPQQGGGGTNEGSPAAAGGMTQDSSCFIRALWR